MAALEPAARDAGRSLRVLDTRQGDNAEKLYRKIGYIPVSVILHYARNANGDLHATVFFYKNLVTAQTYSNLSSHPLKLNKGGIRRFDDCVRGQELY